MTLSFNGFVADVRRHFGKYTPLHKSRMLFKFSVAFTIFSLVLTGTGVFVDQLHSEDPREITMKDGRTYYAPGIVVSNTGLNLIFPDCVTPETPVRELSRLFDPKGVSFDLLTQGPLENDEVFNMFINPGEDSVSAYHFGDFHKFHILGIASKVLGYIAIGLQLLSLIISIVTQTPPCSFMTNRPVFGQTDAAHRWGGIHHGLMMLSILVLMINLAVVSTFLDLCVGRVIELSFELCNFSPASLELDLMKIYGNFISHYSHVNGATGGLFRLAIGLSIVQLTMVFFQGTDQVRSDAGSIGYSIPASKLRQLPWYCSIWRFRFAFLFFAVAVLVDTCTSYYTRYHGYVLNVYAWKTVGSVSTGTGSTRTGSLSDFVMDATSKFYISESIPSGIMWGWLPLILALGLGSTDPARFVSKLLQLFGILVALRSFFSLSTIAPIPSTVISRPYCYDEPITGFSLNALFQPASGCNHLMYSLHAASTTMSVGVIIMFTRFGPLDKGKIGTYFVLFLTAVVCALLPIVARMNYSMDCFVGFLIAILLVFSQSPAWKLLFRFDFTGLARFTTNLPGEILSDKIIPTLTECVKRIESYRTATLATPALQMSPADIEEIKQLYITVGEAIDIAKAAKHVEPISPVGLKRSVLQQKKVETPPDADVADILSSIIASQRMEIAIVEPTPIATHITPSVSNQTAVGGLSPIPVVANIAIAAATPASPNVDDDEEDPSFFSQ